jgi:hypothetical protein
MRGIDDRRPLVFEPGAHTPVQTIRLFLEVFRMWIVTTDQLHQFLRMHVVAVAVAGILLRHRARHAAVADHIFFARGFGGHRARA